MSGVFDRLQQKLPDPDEENAGPSPLDLAELPQHQKSIMRLMLSEYELAYDALLEAVEDFREDRRMSQKELDEALEILATERWLLIVGEGDATYRVNMKRRAGSKLDVWADLSSRIKSANQESPDTDTSTQFL